MTPEEFEHIVPCLRPLMVRVGRDFFGNRDDAEDVAQESLACLWTYFNNQLPLTLSFLRGGCFDLLL